MLTLYYSKGSSALAAHILLEETGAPYVAAEVSIPTGEHLASDFLRMNPKGRIPVLDTQGGVITENPAILEYIAAAHPSANLLPHSAFAQAQARSLCAYLCATVHVAFGHKNRGTRWADEASVIAHMQRKVPQNLATCASYLENHAFVGPMAIGAQYTFCDPYLFLVGRWMAACDLSLAPYPNLNGHHAEMRTRPATQVVLAAHGLD